MMESNKEINGIKARKIRNNIMQNERGKQFSAETPSYIQKHIHSWVADYINSNYTIDIELENNTGEIKIVNGSAKPTLHNEKIFIKAPPLRESIHDSNFREKARQEVGSNFYTYLDEYISEKEPSQLINNPSEDEITRVISNFEDWLNQKITKSFGESYINKLKEIEGIQVHKKEKKNA